MFRPIRYLFLFLFWALIPGINYGQSDGFDTTKISVEEPAKTTVFALHKEDKNVSEFKGWSSLEIMLSVIVLSFGFLIILLEVYLIKINKISADNAIKFIILTLVVTASLFLITVGYSSTQIASAMGLLGTIAGYLLGKTSSTTAN